MPNASMILTGLLQALLILLVAPLFTGRARVLRAKMHSRKGPPVVQNYRDIMKLLKRQEVVPAQASWVFQITPYVLMTTMVLIAMIIPILTVDSPLGVIGDLILVIYLFALTRFFFSLAGIDSGNPFAGIGANREMTMAILIEPVMVLVLFVMALLANSTNLGTVSTRVATGQINYQAAVWLGMLAFAFATFVEMNKLPFDLGEAEQELQEGPLAEYSGRSLALLKWGLAMKQVLIASLFVAVFIPFGNSPALDLVSPVVSFIAFIIKVGIFFAVAALFENGMARVRFMQASEMIWIALGTALVSFVFYLANV